MLVDSGVTGVRTVAKRVPVPWRAWYLIRYELFVANYELRITNYRARRALLS
jgi:hypothetical protein